MNTTYQGESQFLAWGDGPAGPWIKLLLPESDDLEPFRGMTAAKKTMAGQRLAIVIVEIDDQELPKTPPPIEADKETAKGGELAKLAGRLCADPKFQEWVIEHLATMKPPRGEDRLPPGESAAIIVRRVCGIASRAELDHNEDAAVIFHERIRKPWAAHCQGEAGNCA
jgi:hypothetical protein